MVRLSLSRWLPLLVTSVVGLISSGCSTLFPSNSSPSTTSTPTGCAAATTKHVAPGGYYVAGNTICTAAGQPHLFHGVDRSSLEYESSGDHISLSDFQLMASWQANVVRIALNQDYWLPGSDLSDPNYPSTVDNAVHWAEDAGMDVILDLHWSDQGVLGSCAHNCQQVMADANSITFWSDVASRYASDGRVLFELYNEPNTIAWNVWQSGGNASGFQIAGMQQLYDAVRAAGAENLVLIGGLAWASDLSGVPDHRVSGYNILYATHPYRTNVTTAGFGPAWGFLSQTDPVIVTEFGDNSDCDSNGGFTDSVTSYDSAVISAADQYNASWTAWAWNPGNCKSFPSLTSDWAGTPTALGTLVQTALRGYTDPAPNGKRQPGTLDAGSPGDGAISTGDGGNPDGNGAKTGSDGGTGGAGGGSAGAGG